MNLLRILLLSLLMGFTAQAFAQPSTAPDGEFYQSLSQPGQLQEGPHQVEWGLFTHPRLLQMFQRQAPLPEPDYELLLELAVPLAMVLQHGYATPRSPQLDWHLKIRPPRSRIGGWKESNALYRHLGTLPTLV